MKLIFEKKDNEVTLKMVTGTVAEEFSYTKMIKALIKGDKFEESKYIGVAPEEKAKIETMLSEINAAVDEGEED